MTEKIQKLKTFISSITNEKSTDEEINKTSEALALAEEIESALTKASEEITKLKKEKVGFVKRLGVYKYEEKTNDDEKTLDDIISESVKSLNKGEN